MIVGAGHYPGADAVVGFGFVALMVISAVELSRDCLPMRPHWAPWTQGGVARAWFGRLMLPGWPSAALFAGAALAVMALMALGTPSWWARGASGTSVAWWLMLAWQALVFPAVLLSFLPAASSMRAGGTGYFVVQGLFGTISLLAATNSTGYITGEEFARALEAICSLLPVFSFWLGTNSVKTGFTTWDIIGQSLALAAMVVLTSRQSRLYWGTIARFGGRAENPPAKSP
jgi:hypothetical protein